MESGPCCEPEVDRVRQTEERVANAAGGPERRELRQDVNPFIDESEEAEAFT